MKTKKTVAIAAALGAFGALLCSYAAAADSAAADKPEGTTVITQSSEYAPFDSIPEVAKGSALDLSFLLDTPAGKYGFAQNKGGKIVFENRPDSPVRFYGNNLCFKANFPDKKNAEKLAETFAATGYNMVRIHHYDNLLIDQSSPDKLAFDAEMLDRLDYLFAQMKKRGIYITTDLYVSRRLAKDAVDPNIGWNGDIYSTKMAFFVCPKARQNWREFSEKLLTHVNKYTGIAWKDDPALVSISLVNENSIYALHHILNPVFDKLFKKWLGENPAKAKLDPKAAKIEFLSQVYSEFFAEQKAFLDKLGVRAMLTDQNFTEGYQLAFDAKKHFDYFDTHNYYGHPHFIEKPWRLPAKLKTTSSISEYGGCISTSAQRMAGKPFSVSEWNYVNNNDHSAEGAFLMGAYGALGDWDMLCRFAYAHFEMDFSKPFPRIHYFDTATNPVAALSERAGALFFLRRDVKTSDFSIPLFIPENFFENGGKDRLKYSKKNSRITRFTGLYAATGIELSPTASGFKIPANAPFAIAADDSVIKQNKFAKPVIDEMSPDASAALEKLTDGKINFADKTFESSTSGMKMDCAKQTWQLTTPRSEAFIAPEGFEYKGDFANIKNTYGWSATGVLSLEQKPLRKSSRILILHLSDVKNTNMRFDDKEKTILRDFGELPLLARKAKSVLRIGNAPKSMKLYALNSDGSRRAEIALEYENGAARAELSTELDGKAVFAYELVKN